MKGTFQVVGSSNPKYCKGRMFWASEFGSKYNIKHYKGVLYRITCKGLSIWVRYDRLGVKM